MEKVIGWETITGIGYFMAKVFTFEGNNVFKPQQTFPECPYFGEDLYDSVSLFGFPDCRCNHPNGGLHCGTYHIGGRITCPFGRD